MSNVEQEQKDKWSKVGKSNVSRSKSHERKVAHMLTDWSGVTFHRRRTEGRDISTIERNSTADVVPSGDRECIFSIEAKCGEAQSLDALLKNPVGTKLTKWWHQATYDANLIQDLLRRNCYPMLFFRPFNNTNWIAVSVKSFEVLRDRSDKKFDKLNFMHLLFDGYDHVGQVSHNIIRTKNKNNFKMVPLSLPGMVMTRWDDFANAVNPESIWV